MNLLTSWLFASLAIVACVNGLNIISSNYQIVTTDLFDQQTGWAVIEIQFDEQPYYKSGPNGDLNSFANYNSFSFEHVNVGAVFVCPASYHNACGNDNNVAVISIPPSSSPIQAVLRAVGDVIVQEYNGSANAFGWDIQVPPHFPSIVPRANYWAGLVELWAQDDRTKVTQVCMPEAFISSGYCTFTFAPVIYAPNSSTEAGSVCNSTGGCLSLETLKNIQKRAPECSATQMNADVAAWQNALNFDPLNVTNPGQLVLDALAFEAAALSRIILGCIDLLGSLIKPGITTITSDTTLCHKSAFNSNGTLNLDFFLDPCCDPGLEFYECCEKRDVTYPVGDISSINVPQVMQCSSPNQTAALLFDVNYLITHQDDICGTQQGWDDQNLWFVEVFGPISGCLQHVFDQPCQSSQDCFSNICISGQCVPPFDNPSPFIVDCLISQLDPITRRFWQFQWGLTQSSTPQEFQLAFQQHVYEPTCLGIVSFTDPPQTQAECNQLEICNWNPALNQSACLANGNESFCGFCLDSLDKLCFGLTAPSACIIQGNSSTCEAEGGTWSSMYNACTNTTATDQPTCPGYWFDGLYNTKQKCDQGICPGVGVGLPAAQCNTSYYCTTNCPKCVSSINANGVCVSKDGLAACHTKGGQYVNAFDVCVLGNDPTNCSGTWNTCGNNTDIATCGAVNVPNFLLKCTWNLQATCEDAGECNAQGSCNDQLIRSQSDPNAACVRPYSVSFDGQASCNDNTNQWIDVKVGCLNPTLDRNACSQITGATWVPRATNQQQCESAKFCFEAGRFTYKNQTQCEACGGFYVSIFKWTSGEWLQGKVVPLNWLSKQYIPTNTWGNGLSFTSGTLIRLINIFLQPVGAKLAERAKASGFCRWGLVLGVLQNLADDCGTPNRRSIGLRSQPSGTTVGSFKVWSEQPQEFDAGHVSITVSNTSLISHDFSQLAIQAFSASALLGPDSDIALINTELVVPVMNANNVPIGQVVSDGFLPSFTPALDGSFTMCIIKRDDIVAPACYSTPDLASGTTLQPLDVTFSYQDADNFCAVFTSQPSSPVYAIMRVANWNSATSNPCSGTTGTGTGTSSGKLSAASSLVVSFALLMFSALIALLL